ncbi:MAG: 3-hydroxyacyl-CoA dehydrogenase family protein [Promethearchaeota archaeon]
MVNEIKVVAIIGVGNMGRQIVEKTAEKNYSIRMYKAHPKGFDKYVKEIAKLKKVKKVSGDVSLEYTIAEAVKDADLIIETIPEKLELKKEVFSEIDKFAPPHAIIATNSSSFPVSKLEDSVKRKDKVLNIHFYNLITYPMADIMRGSETSDETFQKGKRWIENIGITPIVVKKECYGFVFNRIWRAIKKESLKIWAGGHADIEVVDQAWKIYTKMNVGPFTIMDEVGLDVIWDIEMAYYKESGDPNDKPPQALKEKIDKGELGIKSGKGFYTY